MHELLIERDGQLVDVIPLCSDACHRNYCDSHGIEYQGWYGCQETEFTDFCQNCGVVLPGTTEEVIDTQSKVPGSGVLPCQCQLDNVVVNRFLSEDGEKCEHGNWIQVPASYLEA